MGGGGGLIIEWYVMGEMFIVDVCRMVLVSVWNYREYGRKLVYN